MQEKLEKLIDDFADLTWHAIYSSIVGFYGNKSTCDDLLVLKLQVHKFFSSELVKYFESKFRSVKTTSLGRMDETSSPCGRF